MVRCGWIGAVAGCAVVFGAAGISFAQDAPPQDPPRAEAGAATNDPMQRLDAPELGAAIGHYWHNLYSLKSIENHTMTRKQRGDDMTANRARDYHKRYRDLYATAIASGIREAELRDREDGASLRAVEGDIRDEELAITLSDQEASEFLDWMEKELSGETTNEHHALLMAIKPEWRAEPALELAQGVTHRARSGFNRRKDAPPAKAGEKPVITAQSPVMSFELPGSWAAESTDFEGASPNLVFMATSHRGYGNEQIRVSVIPLGAKDSAELKADKAKLRDFVDTIAKQITASPTLFDPTPDKLAERQQFAGATWYVYDMVQDLHEDGIDRRVLISYNCRLIDGWFIMAATMSNSYSTPGTPQLNPGELFERRAPYDPIFEAILESCTVSDHEDPQPAP